MHGNAHAGFSIPETEADQDPLVRRLQQYAQEILGRNRIEVISRTNNLVARVSGRTKPDLVVKALTDGDVDTDVWNLVESKLRGGIPTVQVLDARTLEKTGEDAPVRVLALPYVDLPNLADWLSKASFDGIQNSFYQTCAKIIRAGLETKPPRQGFGPFKHGRNLYPTPQQYYASQVEKFARRIAATGVAGPVNWTAFETSMIGAFENYLESETQYGVMPVDLNFKNFLVEADGTLIVLNIPIFVYGPLAHGLASAVFQARSQDSQSSAARALLDLFPDVAPGSLALFESYNALGVLAFYAHEGPEAILSTPMWGSDRLLIDVMVETGREAGLFAG